MAHAEYFEDYVVGGKRVTSGRTITEADVVIHAVRARLSLVSESLTEP